MSIPKLYTFEESGNSYKVRLLASLLNIELEEIKVDYDRNEQRSPEFLAINPRGTIPALAVGDRTLTDSAAILVYLAGRYADLGSTKGPSSYWSSDAVEQATIMDWLAFDASWILPGLSKARYTLSWIRTQSGRDPSTTEKELKQAQERAHKSLIILQKHLEEHEWLAGDGPTIADICVFPYVALAPMGDISLEPYPTVQHWIARIKALEGFIGMDGLEDPMYRRRGRG